MPKICYIIIKFLNVISDINYIFLPLIIDFSIIGVLVENFLNKSFSMVHFSIFGLAVALLYRMSNHKIGQTLLYNKVQKTLYMRGYVNMKKIGLKYVNIKSRDDKAKFDKRLKEMLKFVIKNDMNEFIKFINEKGTRNFKTKTHIAYYKRLLEVLDLGNHNDITAIEDLKENDELSLSNHDYTVTFKCIKKDREIFERAIVVPYKFLFICDIDDIKISKNQYLISVNIK